MNGPVLEMRWAYDCHNGALPTWYWQPMTGTSPADPGQPVITAGDLVPGAFDHVERALPTPVPIIAPADRDPHGYAYVQNHTFFWVDQAPGQWAPVTATASVPGLSVTVTATPERLDIDTGDGSGVSCPGAPLALPLGASPSGFRGCGYIYTDSSAMAPNGATFQVTATIVWHATWQATDGSGGDLGLLTTTSAPYDLAVAEVQALVTDT